MRYWLLPMLVLPTAVLVAQPVDSPRPCNSADMDAYRAELRQALQASWKSPRTTTSVTCTVIIAQNFRGEVLDVGVEECSQDFPGLKRSVENAAYDASPLPLPQNRACFDRRVRLQLEYRTADNQ